MTDFIERHTRLFREGRIEEMLDDCAYPLGVQGRDGLQVLADRAAYRRWLETWQAGLDDRAMRESHLDIHTLELPRSGRFRVWIARSFADPDGAARIDIDVLYYCRMGAGGPLIEMIEFGAPPETPA